ncbi:MAG: hypothetical protein AB7F86_00900 [Bdellovibrionales bacterium]
MTSSILALLLSLSFAQSGSKDWKLVQEEDAVLKVPVCRAFTSVISGSPIAAELSLSFPKEMNHPPMMILKIPAGSGVERAVIPFSSREKEDLLIFQAGASANQQDLLWYVPMQMEKMVDIIIGDRYLPIQFTKDGKAVNGRISLSGSSATMNLVSTCLGRDEILPTKFFRELNRPAGSAPLGDDRSVGQLIQYVDGAYVQYVAALTTEADIAKLRDQMKPLIRQETDAQRALDTAEQNLQRAINTASATEAKIQQGEARLQVIPGEIARLEAARPAAEQDMQSKYAVYEPLKRQAEGYQARIDSAAQRAQAVEQEIDRRESAISSAESRIRELQTESARLSDRIAGIDSSLTPKERRRAELESELATYNVEYEKQKILNDDWSYQQLEREKDQLQNQLRQTRQELQRAEQRLRQAEDRLRQCRNRPNPNCSAEEQEYNQANNEVSNLRSNLSSLQQRITYNESQMRQKEQEAERRALAKRDDLAAELRRVVGEIAGLRAERDQATNRIQTIHTVAIPQLQNDISRAQSELPSLRRDLGIAQNDVRVAREELRQYKASVGYDRIENEYRVARDRFQQIVGGLEDLREEQTNLNRNLPTWRTQLDRQRQDVQRLTPLRDQARAQLVSIQNQLKPLRDQEKALVDGLAAIQQQFDELRRLYQTLTALLLG